MDRVVIDSISKDKQILLRANGQVIAFDGFLKLYQEGKDDADDDDENRLLPNVEEGEDVSKKQIKQMAMIRLMENPPLIMNGFTQ